MYEHGETAIHFEKSLFLVCYLDHRREGTTAAVLSEEAAEPGGQLSSRAPEPDGQLSRGAPEPGGELSRGAPEPGLGVSFQLDKQLTRQGSMLS